MLSKRLMGLSRGTFVNTQYKRCHGSFIDTFGNTICSVNDCQRVDIENVVNSTIKGKAILLKNVGDSTINKYNLDVSQSARNSIERDMLLAKYQCDPGVYLIRNWSKCPELCDGEFVAGGVNILIEHNGYHYSLLMKDKTKKYLTCPGGTATISDIRDNVNIGVRELLEETTSVNNFDGIDLSHLKLDKLCKFYFRSRFFDIDNIPDIYTMNTFYISTNNTISTYLSLLFDDRNLCDEHCYKLQYLDHDETEFTYALNLTSNKNINPSTVTLDDVLALFQKEEREIIRKHNHPVTYLHTAMSQFNLFNHYGVINSGSPTIVKNTETFNFPGNLVKLELLPKE